MQQDKGGPLRIIYILKAPKGTALVHRKVYKEPPKKEKRNIQKNH
jgi:hypothetical protein